MKEFFEYSKELGLVLGLILGISLVFCTLVAAIAITIASYWTEYKCENYQMMTGKRSQYIFLDACYIEHEGEWKRWDEYKAIQREVKMKW